VNKNFRRSPLVFWLVSLSIFSYITVVIPIHGIKAETNSIDFTKQSSKRSSAQQLFDRAIQKINGEDYEGAINDLTKVIEQYPSFAPAYNQRGIAKYQMGRYKGAIADFAEAMRLAPNDKDYQNNYRSAQTKLSQSNDSQENQNAISSKKEFSQDCIDLTIMTKLARIAEDEAESIKIIDQLRFNACDLGLDLGSSFNYPNGNRAKLYDNWQYPNGNRAKLYDNWSYPNGNRAKLYDNWSYPNGNRAGAVGVLLTYACRNLDEQTCSNRLSDFKSMDTFFQDLTAIELAWFAYRIEQNQQKKN
jgi:tetratricopeptide (TPR) repeat protein